MAFWNIRSSSLSTVSGGGGTLEVSATFGMVLSGAVGCCLQSTVDEASAALPVSSGMPSEFAILGEMGNSAKAACTFSTKTGFIWKVYNPHHWRRL